MRKQARITSKGQVTIPRQIRRLLRVKTGDRLILEGDRRGVRVRPVEKASPFAPFRGIGNTGIGRGRKAVIAWVRRLRGRERLRSFHPR